MTIRTLTAGTVCIIVAVCGSMGAEHPVGLNENHPYAVLTTAYRTPHVPWANPYNGGPVKMLVMAPYWSQRETIELAQRLSADITPWMPVGFSEMTASASDPAFAFFLPPPALVHRLLKECVRKDYHVIVVGKLLWSALPPKERFELLRKVSEGTGLVYVNPPAEDRELAVVFGDSTVTMEASCITDNLPLGALPAFKGKDITQLARTGTFGKGRFVVLDYGKEALPDKTAAQAGWPCLTPNWDRRDPKEEGFVPLADLPEMEFVPYEYYQALLIRAILWAGQRTTATRVQLSLEPIVPWPASDHRAEIRIHDLPPNAALKAVARHRYAYDRTYDLGTVQAQARMRVPLPDLAAGEHLLDVWLLDRETNEVITWASTHVRIEADCGSVKLALSTSSHDPSDAIEGTATLPRPLRDDEGIRLRLWDNIGRLIASRETAADGITLPFRFTPFPVLTGLHRVEAVLLRGGQEVTSASLDFPIRARLRWDDVNSVVWAGGENAYLNHVMLRKLATEDEADSIDIGWRGATAARNIAAAGLSHTPYTARYGVHGPGKDNVVPVLNDKAYGCMSSPVTLANLDTWGDAQSRIYGPYGPFVWTHGDETNYGHHAPDICWSETCLAAWRAFLRDAYSDIGELNTEWRTNYADFADAMPLTFAEAKETGAYARWVTHRLSSDRVFAEFYRRSGQALAKHDPDGRGAGFDGGVGLQMPNSGGDWWVLSQSLDLLHAYMLDSGQMEVFRSFARPGQVTGMWYGTYGPAWQIGPNTVPYCHFFPWYSLFHGLNTTWFWTMGAPGPLGGYAPDMTSLPFFAARTRALKRIKAGIGRLLLDSVRQNDGIAIHFSEASRIADSLYAAKDGDWSLSYANAIVDVNKALEDCGLQYEYVSYEEVARGELTAPNFRVLILPHSRALSAPEAEAIRAFVRKGGVALADIVPGVLNGRGAPKPTGMLSDLFPEDTPGTVTTLAKGKAVLLGERLLRGYGKAHMHQMGWTKLDGRWTLLGNALRDHAQLEPVVRIQPTAKDAMPPTEITRFACGTAEFVALLREYFLYDNDPYDARITFPRERHIYDTMAGTYLGYTRDITARVSHEAGLYWLAPYRVEAVTMRTTTPAVAGIATEVHLQIKASGNVQPTRHCFRLEVTSPTGSDLPHYACNVLAEQGRATAAVPWALNDSPGTYVVTAKDVNTGTRAHVEVTLE